MLNSTLTFNLNVMNITERVERNQSALKLIQMDDNNHVDFQWFLSFKLSLTEVLQFSWHSKAEFFGWRL